MNRISETIKQLFPDDFDELKPVKRPWWEKIDYEKLLSGWRIWAISIPIAVIVWLGVYYWNFFLQLDYAVLTEKAHVEVCLQRRKEVLKTLAQKVAEYGGYENEVLKSIASKRGYPRPVGDDIKQAMTAKADDLKSDGEKLGRLLGHFMLMAEAYPQLKLNENFQLLMKALIAVERDLASHRMAYNWAKCNHCCQLDEFPRWLYANFIFGLERYDYIPVDKDVHQLVPLDEGSHVNSFQRDKWKKKKK